MLDIGICRAISEFEAIAEANIRAAHGEVATRPKPTGIPEHIYVGAVHAQDEDQKALNAEIDAQRRALEEF